MSDTSNPIGHPASQPQAKSRSNYVLQPDKKTFCPNCFADVVLLCRADGNNRKPWFYICFVCKTVCEVGKGECRWEGV